MSREAIAAAAEAPLIRPMGFCGAFSIICAHTRHMKMGRHRHKELARLRGRASYVNSEIFLDKNQKVLVIF
jgi:hypothetical protein